jgi:hypothetical protein
MRAWLKVSLIAFLAGFALNCVAHADEVAITIVGTACAQMSSGCGPTVPYSVSYDVNTTSGQLVPSFEPGTFNGCAGPCLITLSASNFTVTDYVAIVAGQNIGSTGPNVFSMGLTPDSNQPGPDWNSYVNGMGAGGTNIFTDSVPKLSQAQYMAFKDPLEDLLLTFFPAPAAPACCLEGGISGEYNFITANIQASVLPPTGVPEPGVWGLWLAGLVGLGLTQVRRVGVIAA